jgi:hypothetical protein
VLGVGEKRMTGKLEGVPQGEIPIFNGFYPEKSWGNEIGSKIPFGKKKSVGKEVIKKKDGRGKKD